MIVFLIKLVGVYVLWNILIKIRHFYVHYFQKKFLNKMNRDILKCNWVLVTGCTSGIGWKLVEHLS